MFRFPENKSSVSTENVAISTLNDSFLDRTLVSGLVRDQELVAYVSEPSRADS